MPASRIFTINSDGHISLELAAGFRSNYISLNDLVDQIFPPTANFTDEQFNQWNFWKAPLTSVELPEPAVTIDELFEDSFSGYPYV